MQSCCCGPVTLLNNAGEVEGSQGVPCKARASAVLTPAITSRRNTNITHFPFTIGQRGGNRAIAHSTRCMWKAGGKSTQKILLSLSFCADKILARRWSLLRNHQCLNMFRTSKMDGPSSKGTTGATGGLADIAGGGKGL